MKIKKPFLALFALAFIGLAATQWRLAFTVVPIEEIQQRTLDETFDAAAYVDNVWESRILPTIVENAVDLSLVLSSFNPDERGIAPKAELIEVVNEFGLITVGEAHVYKIKGRGKVIEVDTASRPAAIVVDLDGYDGSIKVRLYSGPRIPSDDTSIRDSVGFITFGDFREQTEYGKVSTELNRRVSANVLEKIDKDSLVGKTITFSGAFTLRTFNLIEIDLNKIFIVPVVLDVE